MTTENDQIFAPLIGKFVVVRCTAAGVHSGILVAAKGRSVLLKDARRLWFWKVVPGYGDFLSAIALAGPGKDSKLGATVPSIILTENCEIIEGTELARETTEKFPVHQPDV